MKVFCIVVFLLYVSLSFCCDLPCQHGGVPNAACNACESCVGAWRGTYCETWDATLPYSVASQDLVLLIQGSEGGQQSKRNDPRLPAGLGQGADITTGDLKFPILGLEYNAGSFQYGSRSWSMAKDSSATPLSPSSATHTTAFVSVGAFIQTVYSYNSSSQINPTLFSKGKDLPDILEQYFSGEVLVVASQEKTSLFTSTLTQPATSYKLDPRAKLALQSLPPAYDTPTNKALYRLFIDNWGTHGVYSSVAGGMIEQLSITQSSIYGKGYTKEQVEALANAEFQASILSGGTASIPDSYRDSRSLSTLACAGGNAAELCSRDLLGNWRSQIDALPFPVSFTVFDYTVLLDEPIRSNIRAAIQSYVDETHDRFATQFPPCKWGDFIVSSNECQCDNENIVGKTCNACAHGWRGAKCSLPICGGRCRFCTEPYDCLADDCGEQRNWRKRRFPERRLCP